MSYASRYLVSLDPGKKVAGIAVFDADSAKLIALDVIKVKQEKNTAGVDVRQGRMNATESILPLTMANAIGVALTPILESGSVLPYGSEFVSETPQVYDKRKSQADPEDLFWLSACAHAVATRLQPTRVRVVTAHEWKHNLPDDVTWERIRGRFRQDPAEIALVEAMEKRCGASFHHALEAGGIGLWALWRF